MPRLPRLVRLRVRKYDEYVLHAHMTKTNPFTNNKQPSSVGTNFKGKINDEACNTYVFFNSQQL